MIVCIPLVHSMLLCFLYQFYACLLEKNIGRMETSIFDDAAIVASTPTFIGKDELVNLQPSPENPLTPELMWQTKK